MFTGKNILQQVMPYKSEHFIGSAWIVKRKTDKKILSYIRQNEFFQKIGLCFELVLPRKWGDELLGIIVFNCHAGARKKIFVESLQASENSRYKGIGTALIQAVIEYSFNQGALGRIFLTASFNSHGFYYKLHLRAFCKHSTREIKQQIHQAALKKQMPNTEFLGGVPMYLSGKKLKIWERKIEKNPALFLTQKIAGAIYHLGSVGLLMGIKSHYHHEMLKGR